MQTCSTRTLESGAIIETDLAIVGTGPAGLSLAREFFASGVRVLLLESGGMAQSADVAPSEQFECSGAHRIPDPRLVRNRGVGGSSQTWSGKCKTFDDIDFENRPWVPYSGWPVTMSALADYAGRAAAAMNIGPNIYDSTLWALLGRTPALDVCRDILEPCFWQFSRDASRPMEFLRFGPRFLEQEADNVRVLIDATVTHIDTDEHGRLRSLEVRSVPDRAVRVVPKVVVLAAGGIENARLLLCSNRVRPGGLGNEHDLVGRFLMDHPRTSIGEFRGEATAAIQEKLGIYLLKENGKAFFYTHGMALSPVVQRQKRLLNCAAYLSEYRSPADPWDAMKRLYGRQSQHFVRDTVLALSDPGLLVHGLYRRAIKGRNVRHKLEKLVVDCLVEQVPDRESRITLSQRKDEFGLPLPHLHWKVSDLERQSVAALAEAFASELVRLGLPPPILPGWLCEGRLEAMPFTDMAHPTGTTRMSDDPRSGVVDRNCRLYGAEGIYIAGSSVFPTASHANPTLMIVAMAMRLADWLKRRHFSA